MNINQDDLKELLHYDPETGVFLWKSRGRNWFETNRGHATWNARYSGKVAGCLCTRSNGYQEIKIRVIDRLYMAQRLAWLYVYGYLPDFPIDHINRIPSDNRIINLRRGEEINYFNKCMQTNNTSGYTGVNFHKPTGRWRAYFNKYGKQVHIGMFDCPKEAHRAIFKARSEEGFEYGHGERRPNEELGREVYRACKDGVHVVKGWEHRGWMCNSKRR